MLATARTVARMELKETMIIDEVMKRCDDGGCCRLTRTQLPGT
jgi:hypothetical protein